MRILNFYAPYAQFWNKNSKISRRMNKSYYYISYKGQKLDFFGASRRVYIVFYIKLSDCYG